MTRRSEAIEALEPCPFPHDVERGVFLEVDTEDFGFVRGACGDCGAAGPFVTLQDSELASESEKASATRLWNTRAAALSPAGDDGWNAGFEAAKDEAANLCENLSDCSPASLAVAIRSLTPEASDARD